MIYYRDLVIGDVLTYNDMNQMWVLIERTKDNLVWLCLDDGVISLTIKQDERIISDDHYHVMRGADVFYSKGDAS